MDIKFEKIEMQNFKSVGKMLSLDFNDFSGLNFVYGKNLDVPNAKNGSGKCVHPQTRITIMTEDRDVVKHLNLLPFDDECIVTPSTVIEIVRLYEKHPEDISKVYVDTPFGWKRILAAEKTYFGKALEVKTLRGSSVIVSDKHRIRAVLPYEVFKNAEDLEVGKDYVLTSYGVDKVVSVKRWRNGKSIDMYDIQVEEVEQYYSNGIVSHNSTIFVDAIIYALFGKTLKNTSNKYIPNRNVPTSLEPYVKLYFRSSGQLYSVKTYGKITSSGMSSGVEILKLSDKEEVLEDLTQSSVAKSKEYIEKNLLGCSFDIFKSSIVISYADFMNFYEGMKKDQKRKYVENLFKLNCFGEMFTSIKEDSNSLKKEISSLKLNILSENDRIEEYSKKSSDFENSLKEKKDKAKKLVLEKAEEVKKLMAEAREVIVESVGEDAKEKKKEITEMIDKITEAIHKLTLSKMKTQAQAEKNIEMIKELKDLYVGLCPKCTKMISDKYDFSTKEKEIEESKSQAEDASKKIEALSKKLSEKKQEKEEIEAQIDRALAVQRKKDRLEDSVAFAKKELMSLKKNYDDISLKTENPFLSLLSKAEDSLSSMKDKLVAMSKDFKHLEILKDVCSENGVKKCIIKDIVKLLNSLIQKYLNEIGCEFIVFFDESFDFKFLTTTGECEFSSFSAGERQRIQIATILAFRDLILSNNVSSNLMIIDELLDANVDTVCIQNVMGILKKKAEEDHQNIFIISHRSELADDESIWDSIIKIEKSNGCSTYSVR